MVILQNNSQQARSRKRNRFFNEKERTSLGIFSRVHSLETAYRHTISAAPRNPYGLLALRRRLKRIYQKIFRFISSLEQAAIFENSDLLPCFEIYRREITSLHQKNDQWLTLYLELFLGHESPLTKEEQQKLTKFLKHIKESASTVWQRLEDPAIQDGEDKRLVQCVIFKKMRDVHPVDSPDWHAAHKRFMHILRDGMLASLTNSRERLRYKFRTVVYSQALSAAVEKERTDFYRANENWPGHFSNGDDHIRNKIEDWIYGYAPLGEDQEKFLHDIVYTHVGKKFKRWEILDMANKFMRGIAAVSLVVILWVGYVDFDMGQRLPGFWTLLKNQIGSIFFPTAADLKGEFFRKQILDADVKHTPAMISANVQNFIENKIYLTKERYVVFTQEILKGFALLLALGNADEELKTAVVETAGLFSRSLKAHTAGLVQLYAQKTMKETDLRDRLFALRYRLERRARSGPAHQPAAARSSAVAPRAPSASRR